jgi:hypothetical protein
MLIATLSTRWPREEVVARLGRLTLVCRGRGCSRREGGGPGRRSRNWRHWRDSRGRLRSNVPSRRDDRVGIQRLLDLPDNLPECRVLLGQPVHRLNAHPVRKEALATPSLQERPVAGLGIPPALLRIQVEQQWHGAVKAPVGQAGSNFPGPIGVYASTSWPVSFSIASKTSV